jgi:hypothetical protein
MGFVRKLTEESLPTQGLAVGVTLPRSQMNTGFKTIIFGGQCHFLAFLFHRLLLRREHFTYGTVIPLGVAWWCVDVRWSGGLLVLELH